MVATGYGLDDKVSLSGAAMTGNLRLQGAPFPLTIPAGAGPGLVGLSDTDGNFSWGSIPSTAQLAQTSVKTSAYAASPNQLVPVSTASGAVTVTLPNAPAAGSIVAVKMVTQGSTNAVTVAAAGSDVFNKSGGSTSVTLSLLGQGVLLEYNSGIWLVLSDDLPLSQLDARYLAPDWLNAVHEFGVVPSLESSLVDTTTTLQAAFNGAVAANVPLFLPAGIYGATALTIPAGLVLHCDSAGTYPGENTIPAVTEICRMAGSNTDLLTAPDGNNYFQIYELAINGNKGNNSSGKGVVIADGASGQECQAVIERCFFHDNPDSNLYLGNNRRANKVQFGVYNYSGTGDGITVCGSDNLVMSNIIGSNARAGLNLGSTVSQNWASFGSNLNSTTTHVFNNDIYGNQVGIAVPQNVTRSLIIGNGIDRNTKQGITVYNVDANVISGNAFHSNGQGTDNTYAHIDLASGVAGVVLNDNTFGPVDSGVTNLCTTCVNVASWTNTGIITGNIGQADTISPDTHSGLINSQANTPPAARLSNAGALIQGSGNDILNLRNSSATVVTKITGGGSFVHSGGAAQFTNAQNVMGSSTALASAILSLVGTATGVAQLKSQLFAAQTADIWDMYASNGSTLLAKITAAGLYVGPQASSVSYSPSNPTATTSGSLVMMGLGSTCAFTPLATGIVLATVSGFWNTAAGSATGTLSARYGTGTAPANAAAVSGTRWGTGASDASINSARSTTAPAPFSFTQVITGLTAGTAYWFDLTTSTGNPSDAATITNVTASFVELLS